VPGYLLPRSDRSARRCGLLVLALRYLAMIGGVVACAVILGASSVLATAAGLVGALLGTAVAG
jgi:type IV secretory pathway TrbD component